MRTVDEWDFIRASASTFWRKLIFSSSDANASVGGDWACSYGGIYPNVVGNMSQIFKYLELVSMKKNSKKQTQLFWEKFLRIWCFWWDDSFAQLLAPSIGG